MCIRSVFLVGIEANGARVVVVVVCAVKYGCVYVLCCVVCIMCCVCCFGVSRTCNIPYRKLVI